MNNEKKCVDLRLTAPGIIPRHLAFTSRIRNASSLFIPTGIPLLLYPQTRVEISICVGSCSF